MFYCAFQAPCRTRNQINHRAVRNRAVRNRAVERPIMAIDVTVARCGIPEAFGEVKAIWPRVLK